MPQIKVFFDIENSKVEKFLRDIIRNYGEFDLAEGIGNCQLIFTDKETKYTIINSDNFILSPSEPTVNKSIFVIKVIEKINNYDFEDLNQSDLPVLIVDFNDPLKTSTNVRNVLIFCKRIFQCGYPDEISALKRKIEELDNQVIVISKGLQETLEEMILRLSLAVEARDYFTGDHVKRVANYCKVIAEYIGLPSDLVNKIYLASPLHDVGKIGIPDNILLKPGKLTTEEFEVVKKHTLIGAQILSNSKHDVIKKAEIIALTHHEKYNGTGYPLGLKKEEIPIEGRIVAVADVFDALTTRRPYKEPWTVENAMMQIKKEANQHFDPEIVNAFVKCIKKIIEIKHTFSC
ncbi:MAG: HD domain-containing protein [Candidatus Calescibacterium sp.]|nr:HD domain-containing protein [Candidatus Calescibacterium sp.]MDW8132228.1 HD domain-containing protein [Candidatus Calescibacterium sp.]